MNCKIKFANTKDLIFAIGAQSLTSFTNFAISLLLARVFTKEDFGLFSIYFNIMILVNSIQNAFILSPLAVLYHEKEKTKKVVMNSFLFQNASFLGALLLATLFYILIFSKETGFGTNLLFAALVFSYITKEYFRTLHYCKLCIKKLFIKDIIVTAIVMGCLGCLSIFNMLSLPNTFLIMFIQNAFFIITCKSFYPLLTEGEFSLKCIHEIFKLGKWSFVGTLSSILNSNAYIYILGLIASLTVIAEFNVGRIFWMPIGLMLTGLQRYGRSKGKQIFEDIGFRELISFHISKTLVITVFFIAYSLFLFTTVDYILQILFNNKYRDITGTVLLWGICFGISVIRSTLTNILLTLKLNKQTGYSALCGSFACLLVLISSIIFKNPLLVLIAMSVSEIVNLLFSLYYFFQFSRKPDVDSVALHVSR